ncbi:MAG: META domain-containing protein, partial [Phototrophicaceae bacterium]
MQFWKVTLTIFSLMTLALAPAVLAQTNPTDGTSDDLTGSQWLLVEMNGAMPVDGSEITLVFGDDARVSGSAGCNQYGGPYTSNDGNIAFGMLVSTRMACPGEGIMEQEAAYLAALESATTYAIDGDTLTIETEDGVLVFEREAQLAGSQWLLVSLDDTPVVEGSEVTLAFGEDRRVSGSGGCNSFGGSYSADGDSIDFGMLVSTLMACMADDLMEQEAAYLAALESATTYAIDGDTLTIETEDGVLVFEREAQLAGSQWLLVSLDDTPVVEGSEVTLAFGDDARVSGSAGCNQYGGPYTSNDGNIAFGMLVS